MGSRLDLQNILEEINGNTNVYYNPPPNLIMLYPAIRYESYKANTLYANNRSYQIIRGYNITVINRLPNDTIVEKLLKLPMCSFDRHYTYDGLNHDVLKLFY